MLERINAAHKGVLSKAAAGYFSFSCFFVFLILWREERCSWG